MGFTIVRAQRRQAKARIGLCGPSGCGKTMSALLLARGLIASMGVEDASRLMEAIGVIDTERRSASLYSDIVPFATLEMEPPYSPERYCQAIAALEAHGCNVIIIDSLSHAWAGEGGLLDRVEKFKSGAKNAMSPWAKATPEQQRLVDTILGSKAHIIATMRSKTEWVLEEQTRDQGRKVTVPKKVGMAPVQRDGIEYEFTAMLDLDAEHMACPSKDRSRLFGEISVDRYVLTEQHGIKLGEWLLSGAPADPPKPRPLPEGTYVKPADYAESADPVPPKAPSGQDGFPATDDQGPLATKEQISAMGKFARQRAVDLGLDAKEGAIAVMSGALQQCGFERREYVPQSQVDQVIATIVDWQ